MNKPQVIRVTLDSAEKDSPSAEALLADFAEALCAYERLYGDGGKKYVCESVGRLDPAVATGGTRADAHERAQEEPNAYAQVDLIVEARPRTSDRGPERGVPRCTILYDPRIDYAALARSPRLGWLRRPISEAIDALVLAVRCGTATGALADVGLGSVRRLVALVLASAQQFRARRSRA